jgi:hypothetical protein
MHYVVFSWRGLIKSRQIIAELFYGPTIVPRALTVENVINTHFTVTPLARMLRIIIALFREIIIVSITHII